MLCANNKVREGLGWKFCINSSVLLSLQELLKTRVFPTSSCASDFSATSGNYLIIWDHRSQGSEARINSLSLEKPTDWKEFLVFLKLALCM